MASFNLWGQSGDGKKGQEVSALVMAIAQKRRDGGWEEKIRHNQYKSEEDTRGKLTKL